MSAAFEVYDTRDGRVLYESSDPPTECGYYGPCGSCDHCAAAQGPETCRTREARPWTEWPSERTDWCRWCSAGRYLTTPSGEVRCERCNDQTAHGPRSWAVGESWLDGHLMIHCGSRTLRPIHLVTFDLPA